MTDELDKWPGAYVSEFVCEGPKNYGYKVKQSSGEEFAVYKVPGITLNYEASKIVNFNSMKKFVLEESPETLRVKYSNKITRKRPWSVVTTQLVKKYNRIQPKRRLLEDLSTLPFGHCD